MFCLKIRIYATPSRLSDELDQKRKERKQTNSIRKSPAGQQRLGFRVTGSPQQQLQQSQVRQEQKCSHGAGTGGGGGGTPIRSRRDRLLLSPLPGHYSTGNKRKRTPSIPQSCPPKVHDPATGSSATGENRDSPTAFRALFVSENSSKN